MDGTEFWIAAVIAAIFVGLGKGGVPVVSALAVPTLALVISPIAAAGLMLPVFIAADIFGLLAYRKNFDVAVFKIMAVAMPTGVLIGYLTANMVSEALVTIILGVIGVSFALSLMWRRNVDRPGLAPQLGRGLFWGGISGFTSFVSHAGAVPYQVFALPLRQAKITFVGTMIVTFAYINVIKLVPYFLLGQLNVANLKTAGLLMIPAVLAVFAAVRLVRIVPEAAFFRIIVWALLILSIKLLWDGVHQI